jgi:hypothetical protein
MAKSAKKSTPKRTAAKVAKAATAKAIKAAAKASVKPKAEKKPAPAPAPAKSADIDEQKLFHQHLPVIAAQKAKIATDTSNLRNLYKAAKADGFDKYDFEIAIAIETARKMVRQGARRKSGPIPRERAHPGEPDRIRGRQDRLDAACAGETRL